MLLFCLYWGFKFSSWLSAFLQDQKLKVWVKLLIKLKRNSTKTMNSMRINLKMNSDKKTTNFKILTIKQSNLNQTFILTDSKEARKISRLFNRKLNLNLLLKFLTKIKKEWIRLIKNSTIKVKSILFKYWLPVLFWRTTSWVQLLDLILDWVESNEHWSLQHLSCLSLLSVPLFKTLINFKTKFSTLLMFNLRTWLWLWREASYWCEGTEHSTWICTKSDVSKTLSSESWFFWSTGSSRTLVYSWPLPINPNKSSRHSTFQ